MSIEHVPRDLVERARAKAKAEIPPQTLKAKLIELLGAYVGVRK